MPKWATSFGAQVIYGLIIGLILGFVAAGMADGNALAATLDWVGSTYVKLLKLLIPPLVFTAVVTSIANLRQVTNAARLAVQTLVWFAITALFSVVIGIVVGLVIKPGANSSVDASTAAEPTTTGSWMGFLDSVVPANILGLGAKVTESGASVNFNVLQILVVSLLLGIAAVRVGKAAEPFITFSESLLKVVQEVLWWVIRLAPIGTAALIGNAVASYGWDALGSLGKFVLAIYIALALVIFVLYPAVLAAHKIPVVEFFKRVWPVTTLGFVTRSSMGVMPVTQRTTEESMGVPREYASFAIPLGATTKMDGCASVYPAIAALFVAQFYGVPLSFSDYLLIIIVSVLGSAATAGTTGATVMLTLTLSTLGLPLTGVGLLLAVDPIIDMGRTAVNVTGQSVVATVVAKRERILDESRW
ncbi:dicarboxylate/amino acid:cation symporter [Corynebacterium lujinxingii]|uniref:Dicarboxylate/amino acid:cation symporter n=1 Tax=Corynebacterium lujinxingii TaxID=2763010 RepID=A0A7H0JZ15_9CORY|nr:dicarboxylate/amino acid:cation symporter [Corynebacterium lujinxingii]MBC3179262.1 dicarboxylate/amino acid:cation symporter [Corynebacterium lujinxingii]NNO10137.1 cation:dicarboxylase symporter family transporter [Corynebacterium lujinxingii]QNP90281.1 dicarboxylate/amino acid:cation symporter [Corynebacterium lujinxingii]